MLSLLILPLLVLFSAIISMESSSHAPSNQIIRSMKPTGIYGVVRCSHGGDNVH